MRYLPLSDADRREMLGVIGAQSIDDLFVDVPQAARLDGAIHDLPDHASELAVERHMATLAGDNLSAGEAPFFIGCGAYKHHVPASVDHLIQRGEIAAAAEARLEDKLRQPDGSWSADYVRLRFWMKRPE